MQHMTGRGQSAKQKRPELFKRSTKLPAIMVMIEIALEGWNMLDSPVYLVVLIAWRLLDTLVVEKIEEIAFKPAALLT